MPILPIRLEAIAHIPHGSGDAEYHLIDADADNSDVIAIIDPHMILDDPAAFAERLARASNSHEALVAALAAFVADVQAAYGSQGQEDDEIEGSLENEWPDLVATWKQARAALATAREG